MKPKLHVILEKAIEQGVAQWLASEHTNMNEHPEASCM
jgi:hypothetical protein